MSNNIYAYTALSANYPEFISINAVEGGAVEITVRSPRKPDGSCGDAYTIKLSGEEFSKLAYYAYAFSCTNGA